MIVNADSIVQHVIQIKNGIIKHVNVNVTIIISVKKIIAGILAHVFVRIVFKKYRIVFKVFKYLKSVGDTSVTKCDEIVIVIDNLPTKKTNTIATNVTSTASINCKKVRDCFILHTVLLAIILLLIIAIICYHYAKQKGII